VKTQDPGDAEIKTQNTRGGQTKTLTTYILVMAVLLVLVIVGSIVFAVQSSNRITANSNNINSTQQTVASLQTQLSSANTTISSLSNQLNAANTQISHLQSQESSDQTQITTLQTGLKPLQTGLTSAQSTLTSLQTGLTSVTTQVSTLANQLNSANSQITALQGNVSSSSTQISALQTQLSTITSQLTSLQSSVTTLTTEVSNISSSTLTNNQIILFTSEGISQTYNTQNLLYTFTPTYSGYVDISGSSSSSTGYIRVTNNSLNSTTTYAFATGTVVTAQLTAGYNYTLYFGNTDTTGTITATLSGFYASSATINNQSTLFTSQGVSQSANTQTLLYTFVPTYSGNIYISGTSSSSTGYIRVTNNTLNATVTYAFGTGTSITIPITGGYSYSIYFGNTDATGTITATLSASYAQ